MGLWAILYCSHLIVICQCRWYGGVWRYHANNGRCKISKHDINVLPNHVNQLSCWRFYMWLPQATERYPWYYSVNGRWNSILKPKLASARCRTNSNCIVHTHTHTHTPTPLHASFAGLCRACRYHSLSERGHRAAFCDETTIRHTGLHSLQSQHCPVRTEQGLSMYTWTRIDIAKTPRSASINSQQQSSRCVWYVLSCRTKRLRFFWATRFLILIFFIIFRFWAVR